MWGSLSGDGVPLPPSTQEMTSGFLTLGTQAPSAPAGSPLDDGPDSDTPLLQSLGSCLISLSPYLFLLIRLPVSESRKAGGGLQDRV